MLLKFVSVIARLAEAISIPVAERSRSLSRVLKITDTSATLSDRSRFLSNRFRMTFFLDFLRSFFLFLIILIFTNFLYSEDISVSASVSKNNASVSEQIVYTVTITGAMNIPAPSIPPIAGLNIYNIGASNSMSIVNGNMSSSIQFNYIVSSDVEGKYTIPAIEIDYKNIKYKTNSVNINFTKDLATTSAPQVNKNVQANNTNSKQPADGRSKNIFVVNEVDKKVAFVNEPIIVTFKLYTRVSFLNQPVYQPSEMTGFWKEDLPDIPQYRANYNGLDYYIIDKKTVLYPTLKGTQTITPAKLDCMVEEPMSSNDFWGMSFFSRGKNLKLQTEPVKIIVNDLPEIGKPQSFNGAVGDYKMDVKISPNSGYKVDEPITFDVTISGIGNINTITEPVLTDLVNFKKYDTVVKSDIQKTANGLEGNKTFKIIIVPNIQGELKLPDINFSYFDYTKKKYIELSKKFGNISVAVNTNKTHDQNFNSSVKSFNNSLKIIGDDIRFIKSKTKLNYLSYGYENSQTVVFYKSFVFLLFLILPPILYLLCLGMRYYNFYLDKNKNNIVMKKADVIALKNISKALKKLEKKSSAEEQAIVQDLSSVFMEFLKNKFVFEQKIISLSELKNKMQTQNIDLETQTNIEDFWNELEYIRFAKSGNKFAKTEQKLLAENLKNNILNWSKKL
jgi:hypothetical protein